MVLVYLVLVFMISLDFNVSLSRTCYVARSFVGFKPLWNCWVMPSWTFMWMFLWMTSLFWPIVSLCALSILCNIFIILRWSFLLVLWKRDLETISSRLLGCFVVVILQFAPPFESLGVLECIFVCVYFSRP